MATANYSSRRASSGSFFHHQHHHSQLRSASPTRINIVGGRTTTAGRSQIFSHRHEATAPSSRKKTCMCSPTTHPGSFRCSLHKKPTSHRPTSSSWSPSNQLNVRRSAMVNSLVRIGTVEGDLVRRSLAALIRPCSHQLKREGFQPRPSRLSIMSRTDDQ